MDELKRAVEWHKQAVPSPTDKNKCIALGVHFEEIAEMLESLNILSVAELVHSMACEFKMCTEHSLVRVLSADSIGLLDSILDQNVTSCGISNAFGFNHIDGLAEVNDSNYSKFEDNKPVFNEQGKISKGKYYKPPQLDKFI